MSPTIDINFLKEYGYCVIEGGVSPHLSKAYKDKYPDELTRAVEPFLSYLPSREEYLENQTILDITFNDMMQQYFASTGATYSLVRQTLTGTGISTQILKSINLMAQLNRVNIILGC